MEPNASLQRLRAALAILIPRRQSLIEALGGHAYDYKHDELDELIDAAAELDVWLSKGGWLPDAWARRTESDPFPSEVRITELSPEERERTGAALLIDASKKPPI
jgi:hypothetical protein